MYSVELKILNKMLYLINAPWQGETYVVLSVLLFTQYSMLSEHDTPRFTLLPHVQNLYISY